MFAANDVVTRSFNGPAAGSHPGSLVMSEAFVFVGVLVALMCAQAVVRHTRTEEETGRAELVGAGSVGRHPAHRQSRAANAWAGGAIGAAFLLRAVGDASGHVVASGDALVSAWPSWLSPLGWGQQVRPFAEGHVGPFALTFAFGAVGDATDDLGEMSEQFASLLAEFGDGSLVDGYFAFLMRLVAILTAGYAVQPLLRLRTEESTGRLEPGSSRSAAATW